MEEEGLSDRPHPLRVHRLVRHNLTSTSSAASAAGCWCSSSSSSSMGAGVRRGGQRGVRLRLPP